MATKHYFEYLPTVSYDLGRSGVEQQAVDITRRFKLRDILKTQSVIYDQWYVKQGERPDVIAQKYYKNSQLDWLILIANEIIDPFFQWPLEHWDFIDHIKKKYGSLSAAHGTVHHYEWIIIPEASLISGKKVPAKVLHVDETKYISLPENERKRVTMFDWENELNDKRKEIKLVHRSYVPQIMKEVEKVFG